jgi:hypothetical protein
MESRGVGEHTDRMLGMMEAQLYALDIPCELPPLSKCLFSKQPLSTCRQGCCDTGRYASAYVMHRLATLGSRMCESATYAFHYDTLSLTARAHVALESVCEVVYSLIVHAQVQYYEAMVLVYNAAWLDLNGGGRGNNMAARWLRAMMQFRISDTSYCGPVRFFIEQSIAGEMTIEEAGEYKRVLCAMPSTCDYRYFTLEEAEVVFRMMSCTWMDHVTDESIVADDMADDEVDDDIVAELMGEVMIDE